MCKKFVVPVRTVLKGFVRKREGRAVVKAIKIVPMGCDVNSPAGIVWDVSKIRTVLCISDAFRGINVVFQGMVAR